MAGKEKSARRSEVLRVAVVGAGIRGSMYGAIARAMDGVDLVGVCEIDAARRRSAEEAFAVPAFTDTGAMCRKVRPDAVVIATPDFAHVGPSVAAAEASCHLLLEKPMATDLEGAGGITRAVEAAGVRAMVAFENHWNPPVTAMKAAADAGQLGALVSCDSQLDDRIDVPTAMLDWAGRSSPGWFLLSHTVEMAGWVAAQRPARVSAIGRKGVLAARGIDTYDAIHAVIGFDGGMVGAFSSCWVLPESIPLVFQCRHEMVGVNGSARVDLTDQMLHLATAGAGAGRPGRYEHPSTIGVTMGGAPTSPPALMFADFVAALRTGGPMPCPLGDGLANVAAIAAIHESIETGRPVEVAV